MQDFRYLLMLEEHFGDEVEDLMKKTPDIVWKTISDKPDKTTKSSVYALFMTFMTYLFKNEYFMLKRKDENGKR